MEKEKSNPIGDDQDRNSATTGSARKLKNRPLLRSIVSNNGSNSTHQIFYKAIHKALEGKVNEASLKKMLETMQANQDTCHHFLILFRNNQFKGIYKYEESLNSISKLDGIGPKSVNPDTIVKYYKYDSTKREFTEVPTKHIGPTIVAFTIPDPKKRAIAQR